jgi:hypothetical protein
VKCEDCWAYNEGRPLFSHDESIHHLHSDIKGAVFCFCRLQTHHDLLYCYYQNNHIPTSAGFVGLRLGRFGHPVTNVWSRGVLRPDAGCRCCIAHPRCCECRGDTQTSGYRRDDRMLFSALSLLLDHSYSVCNCLDDARRSCSTWHAAAIVFRWRCHSCKRYLGGCLQWTQVWPKRCLRAA